MTVERHLVGAGGFRNGVDADALDAMFVKHVLRRLQDLISGTHAIRNAVCHRSLLVSLNFRPTS